MKNLLVKLKKNNIHVSLDKDDLKVKFNDSSLPHDLVEELKKNKEQLISYLKNNTGAEKDYVSIPAAASQPSYSLSSSQRRLWIVSQDAEGNAAYNMPRVEAFEGNLDPAALNLAFRALIERHEILRTVFKEDETLGMRQYIKTASEQDFNLSYQDLRGATGNTLQQLIKADKATPFNLTTGPLLRLSLYQVEDHKWIFCYVIHHILSDGWSLNLMTKELQALYAAYSSGGKNTLAPLRIQYKDYAAWQQALLSSDHLKTHKDYWLKQFEGELPVLEMPGDKPRPVVKSYNGGKIVTLLNKEITAGIRQLSKAHGGTLFMGLLAGVNALLYKYTGQTDLIIGSPIAGREHPDLENQLGLYLNTLALRARFKDEDTFADLLNTIKEVTLSAYEHQAYPFDELVENLDLKRDIARSALYDVMVALQNTELAGINANTGSQSVMALNDYNSGTSAISKFDLTFDFIESGEALCVCLEYNSDLFNSSSAERLAKHLEQLFTACIAAPDMPLKTLNFLSTSETQQLLVDFNATATAYPHDKTIVALFEEQAAKHPANAAINMEGVTLTYKALNDKANLLAAYLKTAYHIKPEELIGIKLERSERAIIALLGILKAGGAYVPIDPEYPEERVDFIKQDAGLRVIIDGEELEKFENIKDSLVQSTPQAVNTPNHLAYVMYTSGSTGQPKGVMVEHKSVVRLVRNTNYINISASDKILSLSNFSFDGSVFDIFGALLNGACLVISPKESFLDIAQAAALIEKNNITAFFITTALFNVLVDSEFKNFEKLNTVLFGGEQVSVSRVKKFRALYPAVNLVHVYGPTENTVFSSYYEVNDVAADATTVPIGKGIANSQCYIFSPALQLQPIGVAGEIYVGGEGLARGYLNNSTLTAEKFVAHPFIKGARLYKTGDLAKWTPAGAIEFIGRKDDQVKIRGYRIELGEIEAALKKHASVKSAVVLTKTNTGGEKSLVAYLETTEELNTSNVRAGLKALLPAYMIPEYFVQMKAFPLTPNGKIDKKLLPDPERMSMMTGEAYVAPRNEREERLAEIWSEILGIEKEKIGIRDNFFDLGGHSLKAIRLINRINKEFELKYDLRGLYVEATIELISEKLRVDLWFKESAVNDDDYSEIKI
jgi:amino acid adenylation domain-containing protein